MIKQNWDISEEDKERILNLHESATKNLYLIKEQENFFNENVVGSNTKNDPYKYLIFQPSTSNAEQGINYNEFYCIVAYDKKNGEAYVADVVQKNSENKPIKFSVDTNRPIPRYNPLDISQNDFKFGFTKTGKKTFAWDWEYSDITKKAEVSIKNDIRYYLVFINNNNFALAPVQEFGPRYDWEDYYGNEESIDFQNLEIGKKIEFVPRHNVIEFAGKEGPVKFGLVVLGTFGYYPIPKGDNPPPPTPKKEIIVPEPPPPIPLGGQFGNNISSPSESIINDPNFMKFKDFVEKNDVTKFVFRIQSSASKCNAGYKENNSTLGKWKDDKTNYPDVEVSSNADKNDMGNLNLTKARAQNLKNFLIEQMPKLKDAKFEVIAQGSLGTCGTEEQNRKYRKVDLTITKV